MTEPINKDPIYFQATDRLRQSLRRGEFAPGAQFLTERQVAARFAISRATANKALASLVSEGLLEFRKGIGTFVRCSAPLDYDLRALVSFTQKALAAGKTPATKVLRLERIPAPPEVAALLHLPEGAAVWAMDRLRLADDRPVILERRHLRADLCPHLDPEAVGGSLYALLTDGLGLAVAGADETIQAVTVAGDDARLLDLPPGAACLLVVAVGVLETGAPLWHERTLYRGDAYALRNWLGPIRTAGSASAVGVLQ